MSARLESDVQSNQTGVLVIENEVQTGRLRIIIRELIAQLGMDLANQHLKGTPVWVARLLKFSRRGVPFFVPRLRSVGLLQ